MTWKLLASAGTREGIEACISRFYCGERKEIYPFWADPSRFHVVWPESDKGGPCPKAGQYIDGVRVILKRGRYRFEMEC